MDTCLGSTVWYYLLLVLENTKFGHVIFLGWLKDRVLGKCELPSFPFGNSNKGSRHFFLKVQRSTKNDENFNLQVQPTPLWGQSLPWQGPNVLDVKMEPFPASTWKTSLVSLALGGFCFHQTAARVDNGEKLVVWLIRGPTKDVKDCKSFENTMSHQNAYTYTDIQICI